MTTSRSDAITKIGQGLETRFLLVSPSAATEWLKRNSERNRHIVPTRVRQYAADMTAGRWKLSDQPITFDTEGRLVNGQHRLHACVLANVEFPSLILRGMPDESMLILDGGKKRTTDDNLVMTGKSWPRGVGGTIRRIFMGMRSYAGRSFTDAEVLTFMTSYEQSVVFAHRILPRGRLCNSQVRAVVARAHITGARVNRLEEFGKVLVTGLMVPGDEAAVLLRNILLENNLGVGNQRLLEVRFTETALSHFLTGTCPRKLTPSANELFPIPQEGDW